MGEKHPPTNRKGEREMAQVLYDDLGVCEDCTMLIANGECVDANGDDLTDVVDTCQSAIWGDLIVHLVLTYDGDDEDYDPFSRRRCDGCGSVLAGPRYAAAVVV